MTDMIHGLLLSGKMIENHSKDVLVFLCPHCMEEHSCSVSLTPHYYKDDSANVWQIRIHMMRGNKVVLDINPSFNYSKECGWHSAHNWKVKVMILEEHQYRNKETEVWLHTQ